ncbi:MAG TPA: rod shape-determining protein MreD [Clostridiales bacterium]|nr:rod shape-determining protein MreD [Clostridiales bacterium]
MQNRSRELVHYVVLGFLCLVLYLIQYTDDVLPKIGRASAVILVPTVVFAAMFLREWEGAITGLLVGVLMDIATSGATCFNAVVLMLIGCGAGLLVTYIVNNNLLAALIMSFGFTAVYFLLKWVFACVFGVIDAPFLYLVKQIIPSVFYTFVLTIPLYLIIRRIMKRLYKLKS